MPRRWLSAASAAALLGTAAMWWGTASRPQEQAPARSAATMPTRVVAQAQVVPIDGIIEVRPLAQGRVLKVLVHPGDRVETNQLLAEIENDMPKAEVRQQEADLKAAAERLKLTAEGPRPEDRAALMAAADAARNEAELAQDRWERQRQLFDQRFISQQALTEAERNYRTALARAREAEMRAKAGAAGGRTAEVQAAREQVAAASAVLNQGRVALARTQIVAPIGGVVMTRSVNPGDIIGSNVTSPTLFKIVDPARLEIRLEIEELLASRVAVGMPIRFVLPGGNTVVGHGRITRVAPQVEKRTIGADDARIRADSMIRPAWSDFVTTEKGSAFPVNFRLEAWIQVRAAGPVS